MADKERKDTQQAMLYELRRLIKQDGGTLRAAGHGRGRESAGVTAK